MLAGHARVRTLHLLPSGSTAIVVLDLSASVSQDTYARIGATISDLASTNGRYGLVIFSGSAYEALPPGTPAAELKPLVRYFTLPPQTTPGFIPVFPPNPWARTFSAGTSISSGLELAHRLALDGRLHRPGVVLISDLSDDPGDLRRTALTILAYRRDRIPLRVVGLNPAPADEQFFRRLIGGNDTITSARLPEEASLASGRGGFPWTLAVLALVLAAAPRRQRASACPRDLGSTSMKIRRLALAALLIGLATIAALLSFDLGAWHDSLRRGDARYRAAPAAARWRASTLLPFGTAKNLLAIDDDLAVRRAVQLFRVTYGVNGRLDTALQTLGRRAVAELALADVARGSDLRRASQASDLLGVLAFGDFAAGGGRDANQAERSVSAFTNAVRLDPANEAAKVNLELVLRLFQARGVRPGAGASSGGRGTGRRGAGTGIPGTGY